VETPQQASDNCMLGVYAALEISAIVGVKVMALCWGFIIGQAIIMYLNLE